MPKRPPEFVAAICVLVAEYLAIVPGYLSAFLTKSADGQVTPALAGGVIGFLLFRPLALYLLWRGTSWVRTMIIWSLPLAFIYGFTIGLHSHHLGGSAQSTNAGLGRQMFQVFETLRAGNIVTTVALTVGLFAFLTLYAPRIGAWFRAMKIYREQLRASA